MISWVVSLSVNNSFHGMPPTKRIVEGLSTRVVTTGTSALQEDLPTTLNVRHPWNGLPQKKFLFLFVLGSSLHKRI